MSTSKFDADIGVMATLGTVRAGLTVRNITEPDFSTADGRASDAETADTGRDLLCRRAGADCRRRPRPRARRRVARRGPATSRPARRPSSSSAWRVRSGFRFNTLGDEPGGRAPVYSLGTSVATYRSLLVDAQVTLGSRAGDRGGASPRGWCIDAGRRAQGLKASRARRQQPSTGVLTPSPGAQSPSPEPLTPGPPASR